MPATYHLEIVTPERVAYSGEVVSLVAPGVEGHFGIWAHHAPFIAALRPGAIQVRDAENKEMWLATAGGFFEMVRNRAVLLADTAEFAAEIDVARAQAAVERAKARLRGEMALEADRERAEKALERAAARIKVAGLSRLE